jgi:hypothetical protein
LRPSCSVGNKVELTNKIFPSSIDVPAVQRETIKAPKVNHDWYQTETTVVVEIRIKSLKAEDARVDIKDTELGVNIKLDEKADREFILDLHLAHPIIPDQVFVQQIHSAKKNLKNKQQQRKKYVLFNNNL